MIEDIEAQMPQASLSLYQQREERNSIMGKQATITVFIFLMLIFSIVFFSIAVLAPDMLESGSYKSVKPAATLPKAEGPTSGDPGLGG